MINMYSTNSKSDTKGSNIFTNKIQIRNIKSNIKNIKNKQEPLTKQEIQ